jgi:hypothetical protein
LKTTLPAEAAHTTFVESLEAAGWMKGNRPSLMPSVFAFSDGPSRGTPMCRDDLSGSLTVRDVDGARYVNLIYSADSGSSSCRPSLLTSRPPLMDAMSSEAPSLRFPPGTTSNGGMSGGGSNRDFRTTTRVMGDVSPSAIVDYVSPQMREQGWSIDSQWAGRYGAGATWSRQSDAGRVLGTIEIVMLDDETMEAQFRLRTL